MQFFIINALNERGGHFYSLTHNCFTSREAADKAAKEHYKLERWSTTPIYPVDMDCVDAWIGLGEDDE